MPLGLRMIKECAEYNIDWHYLHIIDLMSILYSFRIANVDKYFEAKKQQAMDKAGIGSVKKISGSDILKYH